MQFYLNSLWLVCLLASFFNVGACGNSASEKAEAPRASSSEKIPKHDGLRVLVNGRQISKIAKAEFSKRQLLTSLIPAKYRDVVKWKVLESQSPDGGHLEVEHPSKRFADHDIVLHLDSNGDPALAVFRKVRPEMSEGIRNQLKNPVLSLSRVSEVSIWTQTPPIPDKGSAEQVNAPVLVGLLGKELVLNKDSLRTLVRVEREESPKADEGKKKGNRRSKQKGTTWKLADVVGLQNTADSIESVVIHYGEEASITIAGKSLELPTAPTLRQNRRDAFVLQLPGKDGGKGARLRNISRIELRGL